MSVLRDLVVSGQNIDDKKLLMMFCGVDALETINEQSANELKNPKDPEQERKKIVTEFIRQKATKYEQEYKIQQEKAKVRAFCDEEEENIMKSLSIRLKEREKILRERGLLDD